MRHDSRSRRQRWRHSTTNRTMEQNSDSLFDDIFGSSNADETNWQKLKQEILNGNVIPVIGPDMMARRPGDDHDTNVHELLVDFLAKGLRLGSKPCSFSDIVCDPNYRLRPDDLYTIVNKIYLDERNADQLYVPSPALRKLLQTKLFPFVVTTSFTPVVEQEMRAIWGDRLRVMQFNNNPNKNGDITGPDDLWHPTVYNMFGRAGAGLHEYVLTDTDMLDFCASWLSGNGAASPKRLCEVLGDKYLLMLGNGFSDWLFRFIWYFMRRHAIHTDGMMANEGLDEGLVSFLQRKNTFIQNDPARVVDEIVRRIGTDAAPKEVDVFISYSRSDSTVARQLVDALTRRGLSVWFDDHDHLLPGDAWMAKIYRAIASARYFVPILTSNIAREVNERHVYRQEWERACDEAAKLGRTFIIPVSEQGFDFYRASIPERMQAHNAIFYGNGTTMDSVADSITRTINPN